MQPDRRHCPANGWMKWRGSLCSSRTRWKQLEVEAPTPSSRWMALRRGPSTSAHTRSHGHDPRYPCGSALASTCLAIVRGVMLEEVGEVTRPARASSATAVAACTRHTTNPKSSSLGAIRSTLALTLLPIVRGHTSPEATLSSRSMHVVARATNAPRYFCAPPSLAADVLGEP